MFQRSDQQRKASKRKSEDMRGVTQFAPFPQNVIHAVTTRLFFAIVKTDAQIRQMKHRDEPEAEIGQFHPNHVLFMRVLATFIVIAVITTTIAIATSPR